MKNTQYTKKYLLEELGCEQFKFAGEYLFVGKAEIYIDRGDDDIIKFHDGKHFIRFICSQNDLTFYYKGELDMLRISDNLEFDIKIISERFNFKEDELLNILTELRNEVMEIKENAVECCTTTNSNLTKMVQKMEDCCNKEDEEEEEEETPKTPYFFDDVEESEGIVRAKLVGKKGTRVMLSYTKNISVDALVSEPVVTAVVQNEVVPLATSGFGRTIFMAADEVDVQLSFDDVGKYTRSFINNAHITISSINDSNGYIVEEKNRITSSASCVVVSDDNGGGNGNGDGNGGGGDEPAKFCFRNVSPNGEARMFGELSCPQGGGNLRLEVLGGGVPVCHVNVAIGSFSQQFIFDDSLPETFEINVAEPVVPLQISAIADTSADDGNIPYFRLKMLEANGSADNVCAENNEISTL